jgi:hypothetical protein
VCVSLVVVTEEVRVGGGQDHQDHPLQTMPKPRSFRLPTSREACRQGAKVLIDQEGLQRLQRLQLTA